MDRSTPGSAGRRRVRTCRRRGGPLRRSSAIQIVAPDRAAFRPRAVYSPYGGFQRGLQRARQSTRVRHRDICGSRPKRDRHLASQAFHTTRLLQLAVPTSARFVAPLLSCPDSGRGEFFVRRSPSRLTAHSHHEGYYACKILILIGTILRAVSVVRPIGSVKFACSTAVRPIEYSGRFPVSRMGTPRSTAYCLYRGPPAEATSGLTNISSRPYMAVGLSPDRRLKSCTMCI